MNAISAEERIQKIVKDQAMLAEIGTSLDEYNDVIRTVEGVLDEIAAIEHSVANIDAELRHYNRIDALAANLRGLKGKTAGELAGILQAQNESRNYLSAHPAQNAKYIAEAQRLGRVLNIQISALMLRTMDSEGEAFVLNEDVKKSLGMLDKDIHDHVRREYFRRRKETCFKKLRHCSVIDDEIVANLLEHEKSLATVVFRAEDWQSFANSILLDYFSNQDKSALVQKLRRSRDSPHRWFFDFLEEYVNHEYAGLDEGAKNVYEI